jgi:hypothetical protein
MFVALTEADTVDAMRVHWRGTWRWAAAGLFVCLLLLAARAFWLQPGGGHPPAAVALLAFAFTAALIALAFVATLLPLYFLYLPWRAKRVYAQLRQQPYEFLADEEQVSWRNEKGMGSNPWTAFLTWREGERVFLLYRNRRRFQIIPKHAIADAAAIDGFRALLRRRISERKG